MLNSFKKRRLLKKSKQSLLSIFFATLRKKKQLSPASKEELFQELNQLQQSILNKEAPKATEYASKLQETASRLLTKTLWEKGMELTGAIAVALVFALLIRQMWFELYEIPTGSMRPTFKEKDHLLVSKTSFGINIPLSVNHFYFDEALAKRAGTIIFTGENLDISDVNTRYFYIFPGKKLYVKRLLGKPGDTLYFYGGKIYGLDRNGHDVTEELNPLILNKIDHIPFISFERKKISSAPSRHHFSNESTFFLMNQPIANLNVLPNGKLAGKVVIPGSDISNYGDVWGIKNFAMTRLLNRKELIKLSPVDPKILVDAPLYLELQHNPNLQNAKLVVASSGQMEPTLGLETSYIPLTLDHLHTLFNSLYTARFEVKEGTVSRYGSNFNRNSSYLPKLSGVPDGCYEFYYGKAYEVLWQGLTKELPKDHPLYEFNLSRMQLFFNLGIDFLTIFSPEFGKHSIFPNRYAYFRNQALFVMGEEFLSANDPALTQFILDEKQKAEISPTFKPYFPFIDHGAPVNEDGSMNAGFMQQYGLKIPDKMYLMLGDNHAMSGDSREFGLVPEDNIRGAPSFIFWPFGSRFGSPNQPLYPWKTLPNLIVWGLASVFFLSWYSYHRKRTALPLPLSKIKD